ADGRGHRQKDKIKEAVVAEAAKHGISKRTVERSMAKTRGPTNKPRAEVVEAEREEMQAKADVRAKHTIVNGQPGPVEIATRLMVDLLAPGMRADATAVAERLREKLPADQIDRVGSWFTKFTLALGKAAS